jgi:hypothetical protein
MQTQFIQKLSELVHLGLTSYGLASTGVERLFSCFMGYNMVGLQASICHPWIVLPKQQLHQTHNASSVVSSSTIMS